ncbi:MAG: pyridoxal-phosphate dependent enzyme [Bacteroidia bacterium]|nr:pyridoxal-phosphate dependent enzyme [Bacteroidia bacterium]
MIENPYSPIEELNIPLFENKGLRLFIKREDLSHPFISGNKWRKLKYHLIEAAQLSKTHLVTFGGPYSNHLLATAAAGAKYHFKTTGFVRGEEVSNAVLKLCRWFGMQLHFVKRSDYKNRVEFFAQNYKSDSESYFIDEGGAGTTGETGVKELLGDLNVCYDYIVCSVGTGSTFKALVEGVCERRLNTKVYGISVLKGAENLNDLVQQYPQQYWQLLHNFHQGGYAKTTPQLIAFIQNFASISGVLLDQVYEGKMMMAIFELAQENHFKKGSKILALHNGGLNGLLSLL